MYMIYIDESGDPGVYKKTNSKHFILSGLIVPVSDWNASFQRMKELRSKIKEKYGLSTREEIHSAELIRIHQIDAYRKIRKTDRIHLLKDFVSSLPDIFNTGVVINICYDKETTDINGYQDYAEKAWNRLLQRYDNYLKQNKSQGIVVNDVTDESKIRRLLRKMRVYNPLSSYFGGTYQAITDNIIEDPFSRDSKHSYFVQAADAISHCLYRKEFPKGSLKKYGAQYYFNALEPILLKEACREDALGIVRK